MKRFLTFLVAIFMCFSLVACDNSKGNSGTENSSQNTETQTNENKTTHVSESGELVFAQGEINSENLKLSVKDILTSKYNEVTVALTAEQKQTLDIVYNALMTAVDNISGSVDEVKTKLTEKYNTFTLTVQKVKTIYSTFAEKKQNALETLEMIYSSLSSVVNKENLDYVVSLYNNAKAEIEKLQDNAEFETRLKAITSEYKTIAINYAMTIIDSELETLISQAKSQLNTFYLEILQKVTDEDVKNSIERVYNEIVIELSSIIDKNTSAQKISEATEHFKEKVYEIASDLIELKVEQYKQIAKDKLDELINPLLEKIEDEILRGEVQIYYNTETAKIQSITNKETAEIVISEIEDDTKEFVKTILAQALQALKTKAITELDNIVNPALEKLKTQELKTQLSNFYNAEVEKINNISDLDTAETTLAEIVSDTRDFTLELVASQIAELRALVKGYVTTISSTLSASPYSFIPSSMKPGTNLVNASDLDYDFSTFVDVDDIIYGGFGEQWNMVADNITQSENFYKYLNMGDSVITSSLLTVQTYLDSKYSDTINKTFETDKFIAEIAFENNVLTYLIEFKTSISIKFFGEIKPLIEMTYDVSSGEKEVLITISETNRVKYEVSDNKYVLAMEYGVEIGSRTTYLSIERNGGVVTGHIYEYNTAKGKSLTSSCADFYITSDYVTVVGNKADGMIGAKGYICEVYNTNQGKLLGYEIRETISSVSYNTLWFNLCDISGIESIKIGDKTDANTSGKSINDVYLNGSETLFVPEYNKKYGVKTSRKFDIEFRTQYFYSKDSEGNIVKKEVKVPMMFIQEDNDKDTNFSDYPADMLKNNGISSSVILNVNYLNKIKSDYDTYIDEFISNKQMMTSDYIKEYIGG